MNDYQLKNARIILTLLAIGFMQTAWAEFGTLFTTASERQIIDENRYLKKTVKVKKPKETTVAKIVVKAAPKIIYKTVTNEYKISGISISEDGLDSAWINGERHEQGDLLDQKVQVSINAKKHQVRLTVRGGKSFYGQSGDIIMVSYKVPLTE